MIESSEIFKRGLSFKKDEEEYSIEDYCGNSVRIYSLYVRKQFLKDKNHVYFEIVEISEMYADEGAVSVYSFSDYVKEEFVHVADVLLQKCRICKDELIQTRFFEDKVENCKDEIVNPAMQPVCYDCIKDEVTNLAFDGLFEEWEESQLVELRKSRESEFKDLEVGS